MTVPMKAFTCYPEYAAMIALGAKTTETRPGPPAGEMHARGEGIRAMSGHRLEVGERVAVTAGKRLRKYGRHEIGELWSVERDQRQGMLLRGPMGWPYRLPIGAVTSTALVAGAFPVEKVRFDRSLDAEGAPPWIITEHGVLVVRESERALGEFDPGRWVLALEQVQAVEPIPVRGGQGLFALPVDVSDSIEARLCRVTTVTLWDHLRTGTNLDNVEGRLPAWALPWFGEVLGDLQASFDRMRGEIIAEWDELGGAEPGPGPYQRHLQNLAAGEIPRLEQRIWAQLKPATEVPRRLHAA